MDRKVSQIGEFPVTFRLADSRIRLSGCRTGGCRLKYGPIPQTKASSLSIAVPALLIPDSIVVAILGIVPPTDSDAASEVQGSMTLLIVYLMIALGFSFLCSIAEAVLLSVTPSYLATLKGQGSRTGKLLEEQKRDVERPLAAILSLNTIAHTVGAAGVGAEAMAVFGGYVGVTSAVLTLLILFLSEIIPKTLGAVYWQKLAPVVAVSVHWLIYAMYPLVVMSEWIGRLVSPSERPPTITREGLAALVAIGTEEGGFDEGESQILENLFRFRTLEAKDVMTPRTVVISASEDTTVTGFLESHSRLQFSRIPVYSGQSDHVTGFVLKTDLLLAQASGRGDALLSEFRRDIVTIPETASLSRLFEALIDQRAHVAHVVDEYGGAAGIVTLEDVVETLLGMEIVDEADRADDMQALARAQWEKRARQLGLLDAPPEPLGLPDSTPDTTDTDSQQTN